MAIESSLAAGGSVAKSRVPDRVGENVPITAGSPFKWRNYPDFPVGRDVLDHDYNRLFVGRYSLGFKTFQTPR